MSWRAPESPLRLGLSPDAALRTPPTSPSRASSTSYVFSASRISAQQREERRRFLHSPTSPAASPRALHEFSSLSAQQRLSSYSLHSIADERDGIQKKTFSKWVNKHLTKAGRRVEDLFEDLKDGINLIILLEALSGDKLKRERGVTQFHRMQNVQCCLDFLRRKNIRLVNIRAEDIVDGNGKLTLGLIWTIILNFQVSQIQRRHHENGNGDSLQAYEAVHGADSTISAREALLQWAKKVTTGYPRVNVTNFGNSWRDGLAFNAVLHRYRPNLVHWSKITAGGVSNRDRLENAFALAEKEFGVTRLIDPEDIDTANIDEKSVITYVSSLYNALPPMPELSKLERIQFAYLREADIWLNWVEGKTEQIDDRLFIGTAEELLPELERFRKIDIPVKEDELTRLADIFSRLEHLFGTDHFQVPAHLSAISLKRVWNALLDSVDRRWALLEERARNQNNTSDLISRLTRGIGITNEKLDLILQRTEDIERSMDRVAPVEVEGKVRQLLDELSALERPIESFNEDVRELSSLGHPETDSFHMQVLGLHQRRIAYVDRLSNSILTRLSTLVETLRRESAVRLETVETSTFQAAEESIRWVRAYMDKIARIEFVDDLEALENIFEKHKVDNRDIQDYRQKVDECIAHQNSVPAVSSAEYYDMLRVLESEYQQLRDISAGTMVDLNSLIAFIRTAQLELVWISEREEIEVTRNWSRVERLDLPMLQNYYKQVLHEMELREKQFSEVHNRGAALVKSGHPAVLVIEKYVLLMQTQWDWLLSLSKCLEDHLHDALNYQSVAEECRVMDRWVEDQLENLEQKYIETQFGLEEGERQLTELQQIKDVLTKYNNTVMLLVERASSISPLWQRGERVGRPISITAVVGYSDENVHLRAGDEVTLLDNSDLMHWRVRDITSHEGVVPSVVFRIPPPDNRLNAQLTRVVQQHDRLGKLWEQKHRQVRYHMVVNTMRTIQQWDLEQFQGVGSEQREAIIRALGDDIEKLIIEFGDGDPLAATLRSEMGVTKNTFNALHQRSQKTPEPDFSDQFDNHIMILLRRLEDSWRTLNERVTRPIARNAVELERAILEHKDFEESLQTADSGVSAAKQLFSQLPQPNNAQRMNSDKLEALWENLWDLSRMYVERIKVQESVVRGLSEMSDLVRAHELALCSQNDLPSRVDQLTGDHRQLLETNMILRQQQSVIETLNSNVAQLRQHVARTRIDVTSHPDVDRVEEDAQNVNVRWENVISQVAERLETSERNLQVMLVFRSELESENAWLDKVEATIGQLRRPEDLHPEEYQRQLDRLVAEYSQLQERTEAIEAVNREGGKYMRDAKNYDVRIEQYSDSVVRIHGPSIRSLFRRSDPQPKSGAREVCEELELLNKRFSQLASIILERRNEVQVVIQTYKRRKQEEAVKECVVRQKEITAAMNDLSNFEETVYTTRLNINLGPQQGSLSEAQGIESVKTSLDEWAEKVREQLENVDRMCAEQADQLPPEQFAILKQKRDELAKSYESTVRNVELVYDRLHEITRLLISFSSESSSMQSWMNEATRRAGEIKAESADPEAIGEQRKRAKQLQEEVTEGEPRLKQIGSLVTRIEGEVAAMRGAVPHVQLGGLSADEVKKTMFRVEDDYAELLRQCQELSSFQNRVASLGGDVDEKTGRAEHWLKHLEGELAGLFSKESIPVEERLRIADELNKKVAAEQSQLDEADQAAFRLLGALEGSALFDEVKAKQEKEKRERRRRHNSVMEQVQRAVNEATTERAIAEGVRDAVDDLSEWADKWQKEIDEVRPIPLLADVLADLKNEEQLMKSEVEARIAVADQLETEVRKLSVSSPSTTGQGLLEEKLAEAKRRLLKASSGLRGFRDNMEDAWEGVRELSNMAEGIARRSDQVAQQARNIPSKDVERLQEAKDALTTIGQEMLEAEKLANKLFSIPGVTEIDKIEKLMTDTGAKVDGLSELLDQKNRKADALRNMERDFEEKREALQPWLAAVDANVTNLDPPSVSAEKLKEQRADCSFLAEKLQGGAPLLEDLERLSLQIAEAEATPGGRASSVPRNVLDLRTKYDQLSLALQQRGDLLSSQLGKSAQFEESRQGLVDWLAEQRDRLANEVPLDLSKAGVKAGQAKLEQLGKDTRQGQRKVEELRIQARALSNASPSEAAALAALEKEVDAEWEALLADQELARGRAVRAEKLVDGAAQLERYLHGKQRVLDALGAPSTETHMAKGQHNQIHMLKVDAENEKSSLDQLNELAGELENAALCETDKQALQEKLGDLNGRWSSFAASLDEKEAEVNKAADLGSELAFLNKEIKRKMGDLEHEVETASRLPSHEVDRQLATLDELKIRRGELDALLDRLEDKERGAEELGVDGGNRAEIAELASRAKTRASELEKKIDSVKAAALSVRDEGDELERRADSLISAVQHAALEVHSAPPICADPAKLAEQTAEFEKVYADVLSKEGDVSLVKTKMQEQLLSNPKPELKAKFDRLNKEWTPLLEATKERRAVLDKVNDLVKQFKEAEAALGERLESCQKEAEEALAAASSDDAPSDVLRPIDGAIDRRTHEAEALDALALRIEKVAPGPDARHLKRGAENLLDDVQAYAKRTRNAMQAAQKKVALRAKFNRLADEAFAFCAAREAELDREHENRERLQAKLGEVETFWSRTGRELALLVDDLKMMLPEEQMEPVMETNQELHSLFDNLLDKLRFMDCKLGEKKLEAQRIKEKSNRLATGINSVYADLNDFEPIGRSAAELALQKEQCNQLKVDLEERENELLKVEKDWEEAAANGAVSSEQEATNQQHLTDLKKLIGKGKKKLDDRLKKISSTEEDVAKIHGEAKSVVSELCALLASEALQSQSNLGDPKAQAEALREVKDRLRPLSDRADAVTADCKVLIKTAAPDADTKQISGVLSEVSKAVADVNAAVAAKQMAVDAAVQQMGSYRDAYKALLNWLEETDELVENQKAPSADPKVAKAQLQSYDVLLKHIEDKQTSVDGFAAMIAKLCEMTGNDEEKRTLKGRADEIGTRYGDLLEGAQQRQARLRDAADLAERLAGELAPFDQWLLQTEKRIGLLGNVPTESSRLAEQVREVDEMRKEIGSKGGVVHALMQLGPKLAALVSVEEAGELESQLSGATAKHDQLAARAAQCYQVLDAMAEQIGDFEEDAIALSQWLDQIEQDMASIEELPINPEELLEQTNLLSELVEAVTERDSLVSNVVGVGKTLCKGTSAEEAIALQSRVEGLKARYMDVAAYADDKLAQLSRAIPLSERFHEGIEAVMEWVEAVEDDLRLVDSADLDTQHQLVLSIEEDVAQWRPEVDELVAISSQLQQLAGPERADELHAHTQEMGRRVHQIADQVGRRAERLDLTEKQSRAVVDELDFVQEWLADARERVMAAPPLAIDPDYLKAHLRNQKLLNEDLGLQKARLREATAECRKVARQIGSEGGQDAALLQKADVARDLADEVSGICAERTEVLEQALALAEQIGASFEDMTEWLDQVEEELVNQPAVTTATPPSELSKQQQHNIELSAVIAAQRPLVERFEKDVDALEDLVSEEDRGALEQIREQIVGRFHDMQHQVKERGVGIESILDATEAFGDRLDVFLATLEGAAESLRQPAAVSADPGLLQNRIAENEALLDSLRDKEAALTAMKERAADLLAHAPPGDPAAAEVAAKIQALEQLWQEIGDGAQMRGAFLSDALAKANRFWNELDSCQKAIDDLKARLDTVEPAIGHPERIIEQQDGMADIGRGVEEARPRLEGLRDAGAQLSAIIPVEEKAAVEQQVEMVGRGLDTITKLFADKSVHLGKAMEQAMQFHDDLSALNEFLDSAEQRLQDMGPIEGIPVEMIQPKLDDLQQFRAEIDDHAMLKEQLNQTAQGLIAGAPAHQTGAVRAPIAELNGRWGRLYGDIAEKEHKIERAMLEMGRLGEAVEQLTAWIDKTEATLEGMAGQAPSNLRALEIQQCKLAVIANDVHAHEPSVKSINAAAAKVLKSSGAGSDTNSKVAKMNEKWKVLGETLNKIGNNLERAKGAAEDVGGEMERWLAYVEDVEGQLATTRPAGGLPETARQHLDDFLVLKAEVEQNTPALEAHVVVTEEYLGAHPDDETSWIGKSAQTLKNKWKRCKDLLTDREKKLSLALEEAIALEAAMLETTDWLGQTEEGLAGMAPVGRLPDVLDRQRAEHRALAEDVHARKALVADMQSTGTRMQYYCEKKDAIPIKNGLVSLRHRFEKVAQRIAERGKQLDAAQAETDAWLEGAKELEFWLDEMGVRMSEGAGLDAPSTASQPKLAEIRDEAKEIQREFAQKRPFFEQLRKRGQSVCEHAPKGERKDIGRMNEQMRREWEEKERAAADGLRHAEEALLESGAFDDAVSELEAWIDAELLDADADLADSGIRMHGDIDTVRGLVEDDRKRMEERAAKKRAVQKVLKKADELLARNVVESDEVQKAKERLEEKWHMVEAAADARSEALRVAQADAEDFDAKTHALLDWLAKAEAALKGGKEGGLDGAIEAVQGVLADLQAERGRKDAVLRAGAAIQERVHPQAEQPMRHWNRVVAARWKEVEDRAQERLAILKEEKQKAEDREKAIKDLLGFVARKRDELNAMTAAPTPDDLTTVDNMLRHYEQLDFDLTEKQPEVDGVVKGGKGRNPRADELADHWKQLWLDAIGHKNALDDLKAVLEEMKRLEGWQWDDWKERYVEWNDHGKARVNDLFRRIDRTATGNVPRQTFIDAIINSKFPTSRLEMEKVADLFERDGYINSKDFINALRFDKSRRPEPKTDHEKINEEIERQAKQCACCQTYKIEKISDGHYRFGETQIKRMVRILRSTVMVRVGGGWEALDEFLQKHDPCRAKGRLNINMFYNDVRPINAVDTMRAFTKGRHAKGVPTTGTPGPIMKIREKTERSMPMFPGAAHSPASRLRTPSELSLNESRIGRGWGAAGSSQSGSRVSLAENGSRPPSRQSDGSPGDRPSRIPSLRGKKGARYNPPRQL